MKKCPKCYSIYPLDDKKENYCGVCGIKLVPADKCLKCETVIRLYLNQERYCRNCGTSIPIEIIKRYFK